MLDVATSRRLAPVGEILDSQPCLCLRKWQAVKIKGRAPSKEPAGTVKRTPHQSVPRERRHKDRVGVVWVSTANREATPELLAGCILASYPGPFF